MPITPIFPGRMPLFLALFTALWISLSGPAQADKPRSDPLRFFEGRTESIGTIRVMLKKLARTNSLGRGRIESDGTLMLVQQVNDEGSPPFERRWKIRKASPGRYIGTMSQALGPVTIDEVGGRYRFRFKLKGGISVEQWISPLPDGKSARSETIVRKLGIKAAVGQAVIRKITDR